MLLCSQQTPLFWCSDIDLLQTMGYLWAPTVYLKINFPDTMKFLFNTIPFSWLLRKIDGVSDIVLNEVQQIDVDCMNVRFLDIGTSLALFVGSTYILSIIVSLGIRYIQYGIQIITMFPQRG